MGMTWSNRVYKQSNTTNKQPQIQHKYTYGLVWSRRKLTELLWAPNTSYLGVGVIKIFLIDLCVVSLRKTNTSNFCGFQKTNLVKRFWWSGLQLYHLIGCFLDYLVSLDSTGGSHGPKNRRWPGPHKVWMLRFGQDPSRSRVSVERA
jgi:hypothetical protein